MSTKQPSRKIESFVTGTLEEVVSGPDGINAMIFRELAQLQLDGNPSRYDAYMEAFLSDARNGIAQDPVSKATARSNLTTEFFKPALSTRVLYKGLRFLQLPRIKMTIHAYPDKEEQTTPHEVTVNVYLGDSFIPPKEPVKRRRERWKSQFANIKPIDL